MRMPGNQQFDQTLTEIRGISPPSGVSVVKALPAFKAWFDCWGDVGPQVEVMAGLKCLRPGGC
jgi:hypothetical protein